MKSEVTLLTKRIAIACKLLCIIVVMLLSQSCTKDDDGIDTDLPWGSIEHPFPVYIVKDATYVIKNNGSLWARGRVFSTAPESNAQGFVHLENNVKKLANANMSSRLYILRKDNTVWRSEWLPSNEEPAYANQRATEYVTDQVKDVLTGNYYAVLLKFDGTVWAIGKNGSGAFGIGTTNYDELPLTQIATDVKQIAVGSEYTFILKNDNSLWSAGNNLYATLGYPNTGNQLTFKKVTDDVKVVRASNSIMMIVKTDGSAWSCGSNANGVQGIGTRSQEPTLLHQIAEDVIDVFPTNATSYYIKQNGALWACGNNSNGQMAMEQPAMSLEFIQIADRVTYMAPMSNNNHIVVLQDGKFKIAGRNAYKEIQQSDLPKIPYFTNFVMP